MLTRSLRTKPGSVPSYLIVVSGALVKTVMKGVHDNPFSEHLGVTCTLEGIRTRFFWLRIRKSVEEYVAACQVCAQRKLHDTSGKAPMQTIEIGQPFTF